MEGLRTFDGDGSRWLWREIGLESWPNFADLDRRVARHAASLISIATLASLIPIAGLAYVLLLPTATLWEASLLFFSAVSYALMTISYFLHARKLHAATWFAPFWFVVQPIAAVLMFLGVRDAVTQSRMRKETVLPGDSDSRSSGRRRGRRSRETFRQH